jgi:Kef-type K+ transport system membrane component KefB
MSMENDEPSQLDSFILGEIQVLLSEKRTALSSMRTGIAVFALPLSVLSVLIATSRNYNIGHVMPLLMPLLLLNLGLVVLGTWLVFHSIRRLHHYDRRIRELTQKYRSLANVVD